ncbi:MAG: tetratricopeptide repeat protein [Bacteroidota bacterium]
MWNLYPLKQGLFLLYCLLFLQFSLAQTSLDSVLQSLDLPSLENDSLRIDRLLDASLERWDADFPLAKGIMLEALRRSEAQQFAWGMAQANNILASFYMEEGNDSMALVSFHRVIPYLQARKDTVNSLTLSFNMLNLAYENGEDAKILQQADSLIYVAGLIQRPFYQAVFQEQKGNALRSIGQQTQALELLLKSLRYFEENADSSRLGNAYEYVGLCQWDIGKYEEAERYLKKALAGFVQTGDSYSMAGMLIHLGAFFVENEQLDSALFYVEQGRIMSEKNNYGLLAKAHANLALIYAHKKEVINSRNYFQRAREQFLSQGNQSGLTRLHGELGKIWLKQGNLNQAYVLIRGRLDEIEATAWEQDALSLTGPMAEIYKQKGDAQQAALYWEKYARWVEEVYELESIRQQDELFILYETEKKEKELVIKREENNRLLQENKIQGLEVQRLWVGMLFVVCLLILSLVAYRFYLLKQRTKAQLMRKKLEHELELKQRELTIHTLHLVSKNTLLNDLKNSIQKIKENSGQKEVLNPLIGSIDQDLKGEKDWDNFERYFKEVYADFDEKVKRAFPTLTANEIKLVTLMKMNLSSKEMATILNITPESVNKARYRLRKKMNLPTDQNLQDFILAL